VPTEFLDHGKVGDVKARIGLTAENIGHRVIGWALSSASVGDPWNALPRYSPATSEATKQN
jgi:hypothetical protein